MYRGYNLTLADDWAKENLADVPTPRSTPSTVVSDKLRQLLAPGSVLDAAAITGEWFPQVQADIFLSHSHKDEALALKLAHWLEHHFGLRVFVDSAVWGNSADLLKGIDDVYCLQPSGESYWYTLRNQSTAHVHMMLSVALCELMDSSECILFLNTPQSISVGSAIGTIDQPKTGSPWLYYELSLTRMLPTHRRRPLLEKAIKRADAIAVDYPAPTQHLYRLTGSGLDRWRQSWNRIHPWLREGQHCLDVLYEMPSQ